MSGLTISDPIKFASLIASENVIPGDTIYMRGGTYRGNWSTTFAGTAEAPVIIQPYNSETVVIVGSLAIGGEHTHWKNITVQNPVLQSHNSAVYITQAGTEVEGFDISGVGLGVGWFGSGVGKLINCTIHDTGSYGIYTHNNGGGLREITGCTFAASIAGYYSMHLYSESANKIKDYTVSGCTIYKPAIVHGPEVTGITFSTNTFHSWLKLGNGRTTSDTREATVTGNTFDGDGTGVSAIDGSTLNISDNTMEISALPNEQYNIAILTNTNLVSTTINGNDYTGGYFGIEGVAKTWAEWQAAGYDATGSYT